MKTISLLSILLSSLLVFQCQRGWSQAGVFQDTSDRIPVKSADYRIFPNPSRGEINVLFHSKKYGEAFLSVYDEVGFPVGRKKVPVIPGTNVWSLTLPRSAIRVYLVKLNMGDVERKALVFKSYR